MRKIVVVLVVGLVALSGFAPANGAANRTVNKPYTMANGVVVYGSIYAGWTLGTPYKVFRPEAGDRFVSFTIADEAGQPSRGHIHMDANGDGKLEHLDFCTETPKPLRVGHAKKIEVAVLLGTCADEADPTPSVVTQGTITATFSR
jgi:hypothetical protein